VIFNFSEVVPEDERDTMLAEKIEGELAVIIRHLLTRFARQDEAKRLLHEQQNPKRHWLSSVRGFAGGLLRLSDGVGCL
jgi:phage/plasmid-associated DNA primase